MTPHQDTRSWGGMSLLGRPFFICLLLAAVTVATFLPVPGFDFVNTDDPGYFSANRNVQGGLSWPAVRWAFRTHEMQSPYPLTWLSLMLDVDLFGKGPTGPHLTNLLLHVSNTLLVFLLLRKLIGKYWCSAFVALLFGFHPLHVETVAWISERKGVLSTFFLLLTLWAYAEFVEARTRKAP